MRYGIGLKLGLLLTSFSVAAMGIVGYYCYASGRATLAAAQRNLLTATHVPGRNFQAHIDSVGRNAVLLAGLQASRVIVRWQRERGSGQRQKAFARCLYCDDGSEP